MYKLLSLQITFKLFHNRSIKIWNKIITKNRITGTNNKIKQKITWKGTKLYNSQTEIKLQNSWTGTKLYDSWTTTKLYNSWAETKLYNNQTISISCRKPNSLIHKLLMKLIKLLGRNLNLSLKLALVTVVNNSRSSKMTNRRRQ